MKLLTQISRIITGIIFIFSGFVKGVDPLGTAYKLSDYFAAFRVGFLDDLALPLAIILCAVEFVAGIMLLTGSLTKVASWAVALFMAVFTPLTLILALFNPVSDCGCFGDAVHLTNWQTFFKNIILTLVVVFVFIRRDDPSFTMSLKNGVKTSLSYLIIFLLFILYNLAYLPVIDFRPYKPGTNLTEAMAIPPGAPSDKYDIRFIYEKDGVQKEFTLNDYPADDTTWKFIDQKSILISAGYIPPVHDFSLATDDGTDMTPLILGEQGFTVLMIARKLDKANEKYLMKGIDLGAMLEQTGTGFYIVTSSPASEAASCTRGLKTLFADETTLKTVIRANPGFVLLNKGTVMAMWSGRDLPEADKFTSDLNSLAIENHANKNKILIIFILILVVMFSFSVTSVLRRTDN